MTESTVGDGIVFGSLPIRQLELPEFQCLADDLCTSFDDLSLGGRILFQVIHFPIVSEELSIENTVGIIVNDSFFSRL